MQSGLCGLLFFNKNKNPFLPCVGPTYTLPHSSSGPLRGGGGGGRGGLLTLGPVIKHGARAAWLVTFVFVCVIDFLF